MQIDEARWRALLNTYRDAVDASPALLTIQQSQSAVAQAQADLDRFRGRGAIGQANRRSSPADVAADHARSIAELEERLRSTTREADRVAARSKACAARRNALAQLISGVQEWARAQQPPVNLPGDDAAVRMPGFAASAVHIPTAPAREFGS